MRLESLSGFIVACQPSSQKRLESLSDFRCQLTSGVTSAFLILLYGIASKKATPIHPLVYPSIPCALGA